MNQESPPVPNKPPQRGRPERAGSRGRGRSRSLPRLPRDASRPPPSLPPKDRIRRSRSKNHSAQGPQRRPTQQAINPSRSRGTTFKKSSAPTAGTAHRSKYAHPPQPPAPPIPPQKSRTRASNREASTRKKDSSSRTKGDSPLRAPQTKSARSRHGTQHQAPGEPTHQPHRRHDSSRSHGKLPNEAAVYDHENLARSYDKIRDFVTEQGAWYGPTHSEIGNPFLGRRK